MGRFVLLDGDPLLTVANTKKIFAVVRKGRVFRRTELDALLEKVATDAPHR